MVKTARPIPDAVRATQARASDPTASAFVSANAGSGKTHVLVQRVIRLLLEGVPPEKILCVTFTKAAAANMAERVFSTLGHWVTLDDDALDSAITEIGIRRPGASLRKTARELFASALETPGGLKVQTIHAFCTRLLHQFPFEANVPARFSVLDERAESDDGSAQHQHDSAEAHAARLLVPHHRRQASQARKNARMRDELRRRLADLGAADDDLDRAEREGWLPLLALDRVLLPGAPIYDVSGVARATGVDESLLHRLWLALGFPDVPSDAQVFTESEVAAARRLFARAQADDLDRDVLVRQVRVVSASMARVASVEADAIVAWAREKMAAFKAPRIVEFVEALPKTATGKIFWRKLQEEENRRDA